MLPGPGIGPFKKSAAQEKELTINWDQVLTVSKTVPTLQVVYNPMLRANAPIHKAAFEGLKNMGADYVRYVPWFPYPKAAVAALKAPTTTETFWDFHYADPPLVDFMEATKGHPPVINFSTIPVWMFKTPSRCNTRGLICLSGDTTRAGTPRFHGEGSRRLFCKSIQLVYQGRFYR